MALPSIASAATSSVSSSITTAEPTYTHNVTRSSDNYPCAAGSAVTHYRVIAARLVGTEASTLSATLTSTGFNGHLGIYDGGFMPEAPVVNCMGNSVSSSGAAASYSIPTPALLPGFSDRTYVFVVAGNSAADLGSFSLSVTSTTASSVVLTDVTPRPPADTTKPVLSGMTNLTREATKPGGADVTFAPTASDAVDGSRPVTCTPASGSTFAIGATTVTCSATDLSNNKATGTFSVTVQDTKPPVITRTDTGVVEATSPSGAPVVISATANDVVDGDRPVTCTPASGSVFSIGSTPATCSATDTRSNLAEIDFDVIVRDTIKPVITVPADITLAATSASGAEVDYVAAFTDSGSGIVTRGCTPATGSTFPIGATTVTCVATDAGGNNNSKSFTITVRKSAFLVNGRVTVSGTAKVGATLTAESTVVTTPAATQTSGQWLRNGNPIDSATGTSYVLTSTDVGATILYRQTDARGGYTDALSFSNSVGPIGLGDIDLPKPVITGTAQVGKTLTVTPPSVSPSDAQLSYTWFVDGEVAGTGTSLVVEPADVGSPVEVHVTAVKPGYSVSSKASDTRGPVVAGDLVVDGSVTVSGDPKVGQTLTATSTVTFEPDASSVGGQWFRGTVPINGADQDQYVLTNADAGAKITYVLTGTRPGYVDMPIASDPTDTVTGGVIAMDVPTISGSAVVDQVLTATAGGLDPADSTVTFEWLAGDDSRGTGSTYTVKPGDVGRTITVRATAAKTHFDDTARTSAATTEVEKASFVTGPDASITGVLKVGETVTAIEGAPSPAQDSFGYQWLADGTPIDGATSRTFELTSAQKNRSISVEVVARRAGYDDASDTSEATGLVVTNLAPSVKLAPSATKLRQGQSTTLWWSSEDAVSVEASGAWSGIKSASGSEKVTPKSAGTATYVLRATNGSGTTTAQVAIPVALPAKKLTVGAKKSVRAGRKLTVKGWGLAPSETYSVRLGGTVVAKGKASSAGRVVRSVRVPSTIKAGNRVLRITGSLADRTGSRKVEVIQVKALKLVLADSQVRASDRQRVTVSRLLPGEKVKVTYQGKRISKKSARANSKGVFTMTFDVDIHWGKKTVTARGASGKRTASKTFSVVNRCPQGGYYCR